jgi:RNA polymerase sigma-70 factor (ECF subfamily)
LLAQNHRDFNNLIEPLEEKMIRSIGRILSNPSDADDALQDTLLKIWKRLSGIIAHANPEALVLRICANSAYDVLRKRTRDKKHIPLDGTSVKISDPEPPAIEKIADQETRKEILEAIGRLNRKHAEVVIMRFVQGLSFSAIAQAQGCREVTARKYLERARTKLRQRLMHLAPFI